MTNNVIFYFLLKHIVFYITVNSIKVLSIKVI